MRKIKSLGAILALLVGVLAFAAPATANAATMRPAESVYTMTFYEYCLYSQSEWCAQVNTMSTYSATQVWVNGKPWCDVSSNALAVSWCGVGGGNGTATLNIGMNLVGSILGGEGEWFRVNIYANGAGCHQWGGGYIANNSWTGSHGCEIRS
jgi:hypothetical protein